ncbi:hypothetical protein AB1L30_14020 [Bremerella sp. JC817]|uniref:hypothetical protein n=1 Tax=Bremerella sp. JC817 TaxID=3231756 RepID=UPI003458C5AF
MKITMGDIECEPGRVTYRQLGFGEVTVGDFELLPYRIELSPAEFQSAIQQAFDAFVEETERDDRRTDGSLEIPALKRHGYPSFDAFYEVSKADLCTIVQDFLFLELLDGLLGNSLPTECQFAINSLDAITFTENNVVVTGTAYSIG